jgi:hypothetical protein
LCKNLIIYDMYTFHEANIYFKKKKKNILLSG